VIASGACCANHVCLWRAEEDERENGLCDRNAGQLAIGTAAPSQSNHP